jgi:hypothetical protein
MIKRKREGERKTGCESVSKRERKKGEGETK